MGLWLLLLNKISPVSVVIIPKVVNIKRYKPHKQLQDTWYFRAREGKSRTQTCEKRCSGPNFLIQWVNIAGEWWRPWKRRVACYDSYGKMACADTVPGSVLTPCLCGSHGHLHKHELITTLNERVRWWESVDMGLSPTPRVTGQCYRLLVPTLLRGELWADSQRDGSKIYIAMSFPHPLAFPPGNLPVGKWTTWPWKEKISSVCLCP